ncbi:hypothetical protein VIBHAR_04960 [Vibrio campbellii ATCC BAA-1116]|uniref:Uncharacterized protein n=1 Tax=Vibrio campbellii (strain ATCC BAA-1116) TaxID=2902295 RepID=A7N2V7_VIBC1|nr:hypothetical protein VIBHAR_04960 [Vibrio campbellii ATCC BAA-1116]
MSAKKRLEKRSSDGYRYTQVTSRCRIQSVVIDSRSRKTTPRNSLSLDHKSSDQETLRVRSPQGWFVI